MINAHLVLTQFIIIHGASMQLAARCLSGDDAVSWPASAPLRPVDRRSTLGHSSESG